MSAEDVRLVREALISLPGRPFPEGSIGGLGLAALNRLEARLARLERIEEAARRACECNDYWDWVTGYLPKLRAALAATEEGPTVEGTR